MGAAGHLGDTVELESLTAGTDAVQGHPSSRVFVHADDAVGATVLTCDADTHHVSLAEASTVLTTLESTPAEAAQRA